MHLSLSYFYCTLIEQTKTSRSDVVAQLSPISHLPIIPLSNGRIVSVEEAKNVLSTSEASKNMQTVSAV